MWHSRDIYFLYLVKWIRIDEINRTVHVLKLVRPVKTLHETTHNDVDETIQGLGPCNNQYIIRMQGAHKKKKGGEEGLLSLGRHVREGRSEWKQNLKKKELKNLRMEGRTEWKEVGEKRSLKERRNGHRRVRNPDAFRGDRRRRLEGKEGEGIQGEGREGNVLSQMSMQEVFLFGFFWDTAWADL